MSSTTIWNVLNNKVLDLDIKRGINIPMIQRDYAQGRKNNKTTEIRKVFLNNILTALNNTIKEAKPPLELDFIYGYTESESFIPLDGQQRLTTLYLLHWYFAFKEQKLEEFKIPFSKFNYQTRQSSEDFLKNLVLKLTTADYERIFSENESFEKVIEDKNWYFISWKYDLTIQSIITMLDELHETFKHSDLLFSDLINEEKPSIVFNFLNIEKFGLSDDLYIKMNSRGKPLNDFENLKAELGRFIELSDFNEKYNYKLKHSSGDKSVDVETYFVTKIDTTWTDYFWDIRNEKTNAFDDKLLNLLAFVSLNELVKQDLEKFDATIKELDKEGTELSYYKFLKLKLLNEASIINYIEVLDLLVNENETIKAYLIDESLVDKKTIITQSFDNNFKAIYEQRLMFYAIYKFLLNTNYPINSEELKKWDRIIRNLIKNTIYNKSKDFQESIISIDKIIECYQGDIYQTILEEDIKGFDSQQIREEKLKIQLIKRSDKWLEFIVLAESHKYLNGQIIPLLSFSGIYDSFLEKEIQWSENEDDVFYAKADMYYQKFIKLFNKNGLVDFNNELFRRALLVKGDYLLFKTNWSLLINGFQRDISWKRLLKETGNRSLKNDYYIKKCNYLKEVFDDIEINDIETSLKNIIDNHACTNWRKDFIENPILIKKSHDYYLKIYNNEGVRSIYTLRKSKYNKYLDPEIKSILLKQKLEKEGFEENEIELGFIETLNQFGITRIKNKRPKIVFNTNFEEKYLIRVKGNEDITSKSQKIIIEYIVNNFKA